MTNLVPSSKHLCVFHTIVGKMKITLRNSDEIEDKEVWYWRNEAKMIGFIPREDEERPENAVDNKNIVLQKPLDLQESPFSSLGFVLPFFSFLPRFFSLFTRGGNGELGTILSGFGPALSNGTTYKQVPRTTTFCIFIYLFIYF